MKAAQRKFIKTRHSFSTFPCCLHFVSLVMCNTDQTFFDQILLFPTATGTIASSGSSCTEEQRKGELCLNFLILSSVLGRSIALGPIPTLIRRTSCSFQDTSCRDVQPHQAAWALNAFHFVFAVKWIGIQFQLPQLQHSTGTALWNGLCTIVWEPLTQSKMKSEVKATSETVLIPGFILQEFGLVAIESNRKDPLLQTVQQGLLCEESAKLIAVQTKPSHS